MPHRTLNHPAAAGLWPLNWPMGLTMLRLLLLPVFLWLLLRDAGAPEGARPHRWWAIGVFAVMALTDKLDGYLARRFNQATPLGAVLDPVADKLLVMISLILLSSDRVAAPGYAIPMWVVGAVYLKDVLVVLGTLFLLARVRDVRVQARWLGKVGTALQLVLVLLTLLGPEVQGLVSRSAQPGVLFVPLYVAVAALSLASIVDYVRWGAKVLRDGPDRAQRPA